MQNYTSYRHILYTETMQKDYTPVVVIGPSGAGKSTLINNLLRTIPSLHIHKTVTTRPKRTPAENDTHVFVNEVEFENMITSDQFLGYTKLFGYRYGLLKLPVRLQSPAIVILRAQFVEIFRSFYPDTHVVAVIAPVSILEKRLAARGDTDRVNPASLYDEIIASCQLANTRIDTSTTIDAVTEIRKILCG